MASGGVLQGPWPAGTTVGAYPAAAFPAGRDVPSGAPVASGLASAAGAVAFSGLTEGVAYRAFAAGYPPVAFKAVTAPATGRGDRSRIEELESKGSLADAGNLGAALAVNAVGRPITPVVGTLTADLTVTLTALTAGAVVLFDLTQDAAGSHAVSIVAGGVTLRVPVNTQPLSTTGLLLVAVSGSDFHLYPLGA